MLNETYSYFSVSYLHGEKKLNYSKKKIINQEILY